MLLCPYFAAASAARVVELPIPNRILQREVPGRYNEQELSLKTGAVYGRFLSAKVKSITMLEMSFLRTAFGCRRPFGPLPLLAWLLIVLLLSGCVTGLSLSDCEEYAGRAADVTTLALSPSGDLLAGVRETQLSGCIIGSGLPKPALYRSSDGGFTWRRTSLPQSGRRVIDVRVVSLASRGDATLFAVVSSVEASITNFRGAWDGRIYRSRDGGANWQEIPNPGGSDYYVSSVATGRGSTVFAYVNGGGVFRSDDDGEHWLFTGLHYPASDPRRLHYRDFKVYSHPKSGIYAYADGMAGEGFYRSADNGVTWQRLPIEAGHWHRLATDSGGEVSIIFDDGHGFTSTTMVRSTDGGQTWERKKGPGVLSIFHFGLHGKNDIYLLAPGLLGDVLWHSRDAGATWQKSALNLPGRSVHIVAAFLVGADGALYLGLRGESNKSPPVVFGGAIYRSTDHGANWSRARLLAPR